MTTNASTFTERELHLMYQIRQGADPRVIVDDPYIPALQRDIVGTNRVFTLRVKTLPWMTRLELIEQTARELHPEPLPEGFYADHTDNPHLQFCRWLHQHRPDLYERATAVANLGLEPWEQDTMRDLQEQIAVAEQAFERWKHQNQ